MVSRLASSFSSTPFSPPSNPLSVCIAALLSCHIPFILPSSIFNPLTFPLKFRDHPAGGSWTLLALGDHRSNISSSSVEHLLSELQGDLSSWFCPRTNTNTEPQKQEDGLRSILAFLLRGGFPKLTEENWHFPSCPFLLWSKAEIWQSPTAETNMLGVNDTPAEAFEQSRVVFRCLALLINS